VISPPGAWEACPKRLPVPSATRQLSEKIDRREMEEEAGLSVAALLFKRFIIVILSGIALSPKAQQFY
jgi:hypothetical protein